MKRVTIGHFPQMSYARSESINMLCTNLSFAGAQTKVIMVTSCRENEGKSTTVIETMRKMAELGHSVVLVDADLRKSVIKETYQLEFSQEEDAGLAHYLSGQAAMEDILYETDIDGAYIVPVGRNVADPMGLLTSDRFKELISWLAASADYVLVDTPPLGMVIDSAEIAKSCDGSVIVVSYNKIHRKELLGVKEQLEKTGRPILGVVLYAVDFDNYMNKMYYNRSKYGYGYGYGGKYGYGKQYGYGQAPENADTAKTGGKKFGKKK